MLRYVFLIAMGLSLAGAAGGLAYLEEARAEKAVAEKRLALADLAVAKSQRDQANASAAENAKAVLAARLAAKAAEDSTAAVAQERDTLADALAQAHMAVAAAPDAAHKRSKAMQAAYDAIRQREASYGR